MLITHLRTEGLRAADGVDLVRPGRQRVLPQGPAGVGLLDGLSLAVAALDPSRTVPTLTDLGVIADPGQAELLVEHELPVQVSLEDADVAMLVDADQSRTIRVHLDAELDPPMFGRLREHAMRDPRLVSALGEATLALKAGWVWTTDLTTASISVLSVAVGGVSFPLVGADRPTWMTGLLHDVATRIRRAAPADEAALSHRLLAASLSPDPEVRARFERLRRLTAEAPFELGELGLVRTGDRVRTCFGSSLLRPNQLGPAALDALALTTSVILDQPDVLFAVRPAASLPDPAAVLTWLKGCTTGDDAVLEQYIEAPGGGTPPLEVA